MSDFCPSDPLLEVSESDVQPSNTSESVRRPNYGVRVRPMSDKMGSDPSLGITVQLDLDLSATNLGVNLDLGVVLLLTNSLLSKNGSI